MNIVDQAVQNQLKNMQERTGKSLGELFTLIKESGFTKHGQIRQMLIDTLGMGYGDAVTLASHYLAQTNPPIKTAQVGSDDILDTLYSGNKAGLRPIHEKVMAEINQFGEFEIAPKKTYLSLRRKRQFAMLGPGTKGRVELGLNMKGLEGTERLVVQEPGGMCQYKAFISSVEEVDAELIAWLRRAYDSAG
jgi:hypothetical protein